jgi:hypothetical protein
VVTIEYDLGYLRKAVPELEAYLLSEVAQWPLGGQSRPLTIESLLLSWQRLLYRELSPKEKAEYQHLDQTYQAIVDHWRHAWGIKASHGFHHRLNLWQNYLDELCHHPGEHADRYAHEVRLRVMLALLNPIADHTKSEDFSQLACLDQKLGSIFHPTSFIWQPELEAAFPVAIFWYLHGLPKQNKHKFSTDRDVGCFEFTSQTQNTPHLPF